MPTISVLLCVYNGAQYIRQCLLSLLSQSMREFEILLVDDGSTDSTLSEVRGFEDPRIRVFERDNQGLTKSLNFALSEARGDWIARQDVDDFSIWCRFEEQIRFATSNPGVELVGTSTFVSNARGLFNEYLEYPATDEEIRKALPFLNPFVHGSILVSRKRLAEAGGYNEDFRYVQDYELWTRLVPELQCANLELPLYARYRLPDCSEMKVDKGEIFKEIRRKNLEIEKDQPIGNDLGFIKSRSLYPGYPRKQAGLLGRHFRQVYRTSKALGRRTACLAFKSFYYDPVCVLAGSMDARHPEPHESSRPGKTTSPSPVREEAKGE